MLELRTFGGLALLDAGEPVQGAMAQRRRLALLALLASAADRPVSRDRLVGWLWPETEEAKARHALSQWLFLLRRDLPTGALIGTDELRLDPAILPSDVARFRSALAAGDREAAVAAYDGPFLDGFHLPGAAEFAQWADAERQDLAVRWQEVAEEVARARAAAGDGTGAVALWRRVAAADPTNARVARGLMGALDLAGDRAGAIAHARVHATVLRDQLDLPADASVGAFAEELRTAPSVAPKPAIAPVAAAVAAPIAAPDVAEAPSEPRAPEPRAPSRRALRIAGGIAAMFVLVAASAPFAIPAKWRAVGLTILTRGPASLNAKRVVVAPLENRTGDSTLDAFGEMVADWTAPAIDATSEFMVVDARTASIGNRIVTSIPRILRGGDRIAAVAHETGAAMVISGRYYRDGDTLRVLVQLTDVATGKMRSLEPLGGPASAITSLVATVSRRATALLVAAADTTVAGRGVGMAPPPSYDAYREALAAWNEYYDAQYPKAFAHARRASALDTTYTMPIAMLAYFHSERSEWQAVDSLLRLATTRHLRPSRVEQAGLDVLRADMQGDLLGELAAARELARATPLSAEAQVHVAHVADLTNQPQVALATLAPLDAQRGVLLVNPMYWNWTTIALHELGSHTRELDAAQRGARQHAGRNMAAFNLIRALAAARPSSAAGEIESVARGIRTERWERATARRRALVEGSRELRAHGNVRAADALLRAALAEFDQAAARDSSFALLAARAVLLAEAGQDAAARAVATRLLARHDTSTTALGVLGVLAARAGDRTTAARHDTLLAGLATPYLRGRHTLWRARIAAAAGDAPRAIALLEDALRQGYPVMQGIAMLPGDGSEFNYAETAVHADPTLLVLARDPAFARVLAPR